MAENYRNYPRGNRGIGIPPMAPPRKSGMLPRKPFQSGDTGSPSTSFDVTASRMMQRTMSDDDIEYFDDVDFDPPYNLLRIYIAEVASGNIDEDEDDEDVDEASVAGMVTGYTLPLGMSNKKKGDDPPWKAYANAFSRAKRIDRTH